MIRIKNIPDFKKAYRQLDKELKVVNWGKLEYSPNSSYVFNNNLSTTTQTLIEYCYFQIEPFWVYPAIELLMIDHCRTMYYYGGWNRRRE